MIVRLKPGAKVRGLSPEMNFAFTVIVECYRNGMASECTVTSGVDGEHSIGSKHYVGHALDVRTKGVPGMDTIAAQIRDSLGDEFDVILEGDHLHVEFDPERPLNV